MNGIQEKTCNKPIFYLDKTWIDQNYTRSHLLQSNNKDRGLKVPTGIGSRLSYYTLALLKLSIASY